VGTAVGCTFDLMIANPSDANVRTSTLLQGGVNADHGGAYVNYMNSFGQVLTNEVNDAFRFLFSAGNIADGRVSVIGLRKQTP